VQTRLTLGFRATILAAFLAGLFLCIGGRFTSLVAVRSRLNTYLLIQRSFGRHGAPTYFHKLWHSAISPDRHRHADLTTLPDLSHYPRTSRGAVLSMILSYPTLPYPTLPYPFTAPLLMTGTALSALATGETDIMKMISAFGFGAWALLLLVRPT
jgi:purine-cytosine permease-like protein